METKLCITRRFRRFSPHVPLPFLASLAWLSATPEVRKAFLVGAGNMIALETAYSKKKGTPPPVAGAMASKALHGLTLDQISNRVTRWYEGNPSRRNMPVMGVIWVDMVDPGAGPK
jgi:hypothetical protein